MQHVQPEVARKGWLVAAVAALACTACADPFTVEGPATCEIPDQNDYVFRQMDHTYYWNDKLPASIDAASYDDPADVVRDIRFAEIDRWSYVADKGMANAYFEEGKFIGYGFNRRWDAGTDTWRVARVHDGSPSSEAGLERGDTVLTINGIPTATLDEEGTWNSELGASEPGVAFDISFFDFSEGVEKDATLVKDWITTVTVPIDTVIEFGGRTVGYLSLATFVNTANDELDAAFERFASAGVQDVVIDLRYNGGGSLAVAAHLLHLLGGVTARKEVAYHYDFNENLDNEEVDVKFEKLAESIDTQNVVFITTGTTISASELVINSLRPHLPVSMVGSVTGGKPVGSRGFDFCEHKLFAVTFQLVNSENVGGYYDGLEPDCAATDDFDHLRGDPQEGMLAEALNVLTEGGCSPGAFIVDPLDTATRFGAHQEPAFDFRRVIGWD